jgi:3-oxoacyl-[acyl-carrier protein] reductase
MNALKESNGKIALVTGASRGIGRAAAIALAQAGFDIVVNYYQSKNAAQEVCAQVESLGRSALAVRADVSNARQVLQMVDEVKNTLGAVAVLVNNAGIAPAKNLDEIGEQDWDQVLDVNLKSAFLVTQAVLPDMRRAHWGRIINISSVAAHIGGIIGPHYAASKAGMLGLTRAYAGRLAGEGVTVNAIAPALIATEMIIDTPAHPDMIPIGRFGTVEEVAQVVIMLVNNEYITGQTINVDGGKYMN